MLKRQKPKQEEEVLTLPTEPTPPRSRLEDFSMLLHGLEKIGKTTLAAEFPDAFFMLCEPGGKGLSIFSRKVNNWIQFKGYMSLLRKTKRFGTVVVDTVDLLHKWCEQYVCAKMGIEHPSDEEWGKGWGGVRDEFAKAMTELVGGNRGVIFISHSIEKELKKRSGGSRHRFQPTMPNGARQVLEPMVDIWAFYEYGDGGSRRLRIVGDDEVAAGHRIKDRFVGITTIPMGKSPKEGYENYIKAFNTTRKVEKGGSPVRRIVRR